MNEMQKQLEYAHLLTVEEVASVLRVEPATVRHWASTGAIEAIRFPEKTGTRQRQVYRIREDTLDSLLHPE